ncbi:MAG: NYN domain-containing protein [Leptospiraceae bacterium]|nr:NYN domain-containing protein [Leptospiraceae bacterium]
MKVLIDALNLIYKFPDLELCMYEDRLDEAKSGLLKILQDCSRKWKDYEFIIFIDGQRIKGDYETYQEKANGMDVFYSHEKEADDLIREYIKENPFPNRLTLITSDKKILQYARQFKVKYYTSEQFSEMIRLLLNEEASEDPDSKPIERVSEDLEHWYNVFTQHQSQTK